MSGVQGRHTYIPPVEVRFWEKVKKSDGCWEWQAGRSREGYGLFGMHGKSFLAHRTAYLLTFGDPGRLLVCHHCDNPGCVRPDHLFLGTDADNARDMVAKGRSAKGEASGTSKLTAARVRLMRERWTAGAGIRQLAREERLAYNTVSSVLHRRTWAHV